MTKHDKISFTIDICSTAAGSQSRGWQSRGTVLDRMESRHKTVLSPVSLQAGTKARDADAYCKPMNAAGYCNWYVTVGIYWVFITPSICISLFSLKLDISSHELKSRVSQTTTCVRWKQTTFHFFCVFFFTIKNVEVRPRSTSIKTIIWDSE